MAGGELLLRCVLIGALFFHPRAHLREVLEMLFGTLILGNILLGEFLVQHSAHVGEVLMIPLDESD